MPTPRRPSANSNSDTNNAKRPSTLDLRSPRIRQLYGEWNGGHDPLFWQRGFVEGLTALAPGPR
jgi:hypothetical protein